jgi:hypothetical protein
MMSSEVECGTVPKQPLEELLPSHSKVNHSLIQHSYLLPSRERQLVESFSKFSWVVVDSAEDSEAE